MHISQIILHTSLPITNRYTHWYHTHPIFSILFAKIAELNNLLFLCKLEQLYCGRKYTRPRHVLHVSSSIRDFDNFTNHR